METLVSKVIEAHGGMQRWRELNKVDVTLVSGGKLFDLQGQPQDATPRQMSVFLHEQRASMKPYGGPDRQTNFTPGRIAIETTDGKVLSERTGTVEELHNHMKANGWDAIDRAYFNGYAMWTYLTTPFFMTMPGIAIAEIAPWSQDHESWQGLRVTFPPNISTHSVVQDFYFGKDYLLRRHDYFIDVAGDFDATQYVYDYTEVAGIKLPTKRLAYKKGTDGLPINDELMVHIDFSDIRFS
jgi:hypothetical protein